MTRPDWGWGAQPQSGQVMGITKIRGEKLGDMVGWGTGSSWPSIMVLFCRQNCEAHERRLVNGNGIDVECRDSLKPTATLTASSSNYNPHEAMGSANSQSPLCWQEAAKNDAQW